MTESKYDKYLVKVPLREVVVGSNGEGRTSLAMTCMSNELVPESKIYIQYHWVREVPELDPLLIAGHSHNFDEIILYIGADPENPEYLGAEIDGFVGDERQITDKTSAIYIPKNVKHGLVKGWTRFEKPHIMMQVKLNKGNP